MSSYQNILQSYHDKYSDKEKQKNNNTILTITQAYDRKYKKRNIIRFLNILKNRKEQLILLNILKNREDQLILSSEHKKKVSKVNMKKDEVKKVSKANMKKDEVKKILWGLKKF